MIFQFSATVVKVTALTLLLALVGCGGSGNDANPSVNLEGNSNGGIVDNTLIQNRDTFQNQFVQFDYPATWTAESNSAGGTEFSPPLSGDSTSFCSIGSPYLPGETIMDPVGRLLDLFTGEPSTRFTEVSGEPAAFVSGTITFIFEFDARYLLVYERDIETLHVMQCLDASQSEVDLIFNSFRLI